ncbi:MAG: diaminopimelate epimerase [Chloroflexota bacterium]|nr:diaminopimelate epimerase [Chloroflexota bacterium]
MNTIEFTKMQATGNDFVLVETGDERDWPSLARAMCARRFGIGSDGLILVTPSPAANVRMRMFNPDGSEAEACGNGMRCLVKYAIEKGVAAPGEITVESMDGIRRARSVDKLIQVDMGEPILAAERIPVKETLDAVKDYPLEVGGRQLSLTCLSMGNPHAVCFIEEPVDGFPLAELGPLVERHPFFPNRVNFEIANVIDTRTIRARVWERGAGETLSCGTGACAIAVAARLHDYSSGDVDVNLPGGTLTVAWDGSGDVKLSGPAEVVFEGEWPD